MKKNKTISYSVQYTNNLSETNKKVDYDNNSPFIHKTIDNNSLFVLYDGVSF